MTDEDPIVAALRAAGCVFAEDEARLLREAASGDELTTLVRRRVDGQPLEHVLGWAGFRGLRVAVDPGVFVPRHRTGLLVDQAIPLLSPGDVVLDLCCGTGALGAAVAAKIPVELHAADIDPASVACARRNVPRVYEGDLFEPVPTALRGRIAVILANVPYVPTEEIALMPPEAREYEVRVALDGGDDGLTVLRRVAAEAPGWLAPGGHVLSETSGRQAPVALAVFRSHLSDARIVEDDDSIVVIGTKQGRPGPKSGAAPGVKTR
ncbi:putative protein N(5)-glutamine methyltransferase [Saccharothrix violaceirubra]|uniref:peptide chain release factor N(5)-glutamine methyltransferase n=1 Tax=Saccharothrix violaceirubra TaxID=413306 RepID=A0A7W7SYN8_9PSEU|nr:putative protein N(5)-glutamine methyltransferase [Saccharothrix violaceirubra]MBB4963314.1 release factor glutamine methyltransferase [Saccharothrix violaceirubra]